MIRRLKLQNWLCYGGEHEIVLGPKVYAIAARDAENAERSNWLGKCLSGATLVFHPECGPIEISEFVHRKLDAILGYEDGKIRQMRVKHHFKLGLKKMVRMKLCDGSYEEYGEEHPILTTRGYQKMRDLCVGEYVAVAKTLCSMKGIATITDDDIALVGCILGDGTRSANATFRLCAHNQDKRDYFELVLSRVFPTLRISLCDGTVGVVGHRGKSGPRIDQGATHIRRWLKRVKLDVVLAGDKRVPRELLNSPIRQIRILLGALWMTDGYVSLVQSEVSYTSASRALADDVRYLLLRVGLSSRIWTKYVDDVPYYTVRLTHESAIRMCDEIHIPGDKGPRLHAMVARTNKQFRKPLVDIIPYEIWSKFELKTVAHLPNGKLRVITAWRTGHRGMSRAIFEAFGGPTKISRSEISWERVESIRHIQPAQCFDIEVDSNEHAYIAGRSFAVVHNSSILESVRFALYGTHRHRTEDSWIHRDASEGAVEIELDSGVTIRRSRRRGKRTDVSVEGAVQKEAVLAIERILGMQEDDFIATSYFEQRRMARFVLEDPSKRMDTVRAWTRLDKVDEANARVRKEWMALADAHTQMSGKRAMVLTLAGVECSSDTSKLDTEESELLGYVAKWESELQAAEKILAQNKLNAALREIVAAGKALAGRDDPDYQEQIAKLEQEKGATFQTFDTLEKEYRKLVNAQPFDGRCPVLRAECPARAEVTKRCAVDTDLKEKVRLEFFESETAKRNLQDALSRLSVKNADAQQFKRRLADLRSRRDALKEQGAKLVDDVPEKSAEQLRHDIRAARQTISEIQIARARVKDEWEQREKNIVLLADIDASLATLSQRVAVLRAASQVFGRNGAQRVAARGVLSEIETGANESLAECGIDLKVGMTWGEEGTGLATECNRCGSAYPTSAKVKVCELCGAERGPNIMQRLDVKLSERSGAAEDLAGIAIQLAASGWLRRTRGASWDTALIDEPFGQLDSSNRKAMATHFKTMLSGRYGFRQAIIVAHHPDVTFALPGRIEIEWKNGKPSLSVVE